MFEWVLGRTLKDMDMFDKLYEECYLGSLGEITLQNSPEKEFYVVELT